MSKTAYTITSFLSILLLITVYGCSRDLIWCPKIEDKIGTSPLVSDGMIFFGSEDKHLFKQWTRIPARLNGGLKLIKI